MLSGVGLALTGLAPSYVAVLALVVVTGVGVAAWHPEGYKTATGVAGPRKATAIGWFSLGGNVGIALGPPVITTLVTTLGLAATLGMLAPTLVMAALIVVALPFFARDAAAPRAAAATTRGVNMPGAMALLILVVTLRSWTTLGFTTFVPFFYVDVLRQDPRLIGPLLFIYLGAGALGSVFAGPIADRWGARPFMRWVLLAAVPFGVLFMLTDGVLRFVMLGLFGMIMTASFSVSVVLAQAYLPRSAGMASGLIVGFAIGTGGLAVTLLGFLADHYGVTAALWISALMPLAAFAAARYLPAPRSLVARERRRAVSGRGADPAHRPAGQASPDLPAQVGDVPLRPRVGPARRDHRAARGQLGAQLDGPALHRVRPTLAEYVLEMPRGAQVIYPKDLAIILFWADIYPGCRVLEAGMGSGALTLALLRAVGPKGASSPTSSATSSRAARSPTSTCGLGEVTNLTVRLRPVEDGLGEEEPVDRVVLDLPEPWRLIGELREVLRPGGIFLSYVPTIIQAHQTSEALRRDQHWALVETFETLFRPWNIDGQSVRPFHRMVAHTGFMTIARRVAPEERAGSSQVGAIRHEDQEDEGAR